MKPYFTLTEVAAREKVSTRRMRVLCETGRVFYCQKVGGHWLIQLNYWIDKKPVGRPQKKEARWHPLQSVPPATRK